MSYEFNDYEAEEMWNFAQKLVIVSMIMVLGAIFGLLSILIKINDEGSDAFQLIVTAIEFIVLSIIAFILFRPSDNFKRIATNEGSDIHELMDGIREFNFAFKLATTSILAIGILNFFYILHKV